MKKYGKGVVIVWAKEMQLMQENVKVYKQKEAQKINLINQRPHIKISEKKVERRELCREVAMLLYLREHFLHKVKTRKRVSKM